MNEIYVYPIKSMLHDKDVIDNNSKQLLDELKKGTNYHYEIVTDIKKCDNHPTLILVQSGGSEGLFLSDVYPFFKGPYYLLTYGANNSLAASLEILTFLHQKNEKAEVLHGSIEYISERINYLFSLKENEDPDKLGVFGVPSDWLISSNVDYEKCKKIFNIELIDYSNQEIEKRILDYINNDFQFEFKKVFDKNTLIKSYAIYEALRDLIKKDNLEGFTIRCFDVLMLTRQSACFSLAKLNSENIVSSCEGDIPAMISAFISMRLLGLPAFQVNPQEIDPVNNYVSFAHCTIPLNMVKDYEFMTHYESGLGLGIKGEVYEGDVTIFKIGANLEEFYVTEGYMTQDDFSLTRCRTQVKIKLNGNASYFLRSSLGNHHQIIYGKHQDELVEYLTSLGLKRVI